LVFWKPLTKRAGSGSGAGSIHTASLLFICFYWFRTRKEIIQDPQHPVLIVSSPLSSWRRRQLRCVRCGGGAWTGAACRRTTRATSAAPPSSTTARSPAWTSGSGPSPGNRKRPMRPQSAGESLPESEYPDPNRNVRIRILWLDTVQVSGVFYSWYRYRRLLGTQITFQMEHLWSSFEKSSTWFG